MTGRRERRRRRGADGSRGAAHKGVPTPPRPAAGPRVPGAGGRVPSSAAPDYDLPALVRGASSGFTVLVLGELLLPLAGAVSSTLAGLWLSSLALAFALALALAFTLAFTLALALALTLALPLALALAFTLALALAFALAFALAAPAPAASKPRMQNHHRRWNAPMLAQGLHRHRTQLRGQDDERVEPR